MAMRKLLMGEAVDAPAAKVWAVIGDFGGIRKWAPTVESESTETTAQGKFRTLTLPGGRVVRELLVSESPAHYTYSVERPGTTYYASSLSVRPIDEKSCMIELWLDYELAEGTNSGELAAELLKFLAGNLKAMKRAVG